MSFGLEWTAKEALAELGTLALHQHYLGREQLFDAGWQVRELVARVKASEPERVPVRRISGGLLLTGNSTGYLDAPVDDFELARTLLLSEPRPLPLKDHEVPSALLSYIQITCLGDQALPSDWLASALQFTVDSLRIDKVTAIAWRTQLEQHITKLAPLAKTGEKFVRGRKQGAVGPLGKAIERHLKRHKTATTEQVWNALAAHPPKGTTFYDNGLGKYIEHTGIGPVKETGYRASGNAVTRTRKRLGIIK